MSTQQTNRIKAQGRNPIERIIYAGLFARGVRGRRGLPYVLVGKPGTAKTSIVQEVAESAGLFFKSVVCSLRDPSDFLGLGVPSELKITNENAHLDPDMNGSIPVMKYFPPNFALDVSARQRSVLMLDEVNTAPPAVQAALLRVLFEGVVGEFAMPPEVRMILAMNAVEDSAGGWDIAPPLANRVGWLPWETTSAAQFIEFLMRAEADREAPADPVVVEQSVDAAWPSAWARNAGLIAGFVSAKNDLLHKMPKSGTKAASEAWPSPRTWELAARAKTVGDVFDLTDQEVQTSIGAFVGNAAAGELHTWVKNNDLPTPEDFLDGLVPFVHNPKRLDRTAAVVTSATAYVTSPSAIKDKVVNDKRVNTLWTFHQTLALAAPDLALGSVVSLTKAKMMIGNTTAYKVLAAMEPVMNAAGITSTQGP